LETDHVLLKKNWGRKHVWYKSNNCCFFQGEHGVWSDAVSSTPLPDIPSSLAGKQPALRHNDAGAGNLRLFHPLNQAFCILRTKPLQALTTFAITKSPKTISLSHYIAC
jgi:hypothetical protein